MRFHLLIATVLLLSAASGQAQTPPVPPRSVADILAVHLCPSDVLGTVLTRRGWGTVKEYPRERPFIVW